jgi:hypothetical protein
MSELDELIKKNIGQPTTNLRKDIISLIKEVRQAVRVGTPAHSHIAPYKHGYRDALTAVDAAWDKFLGDRE